MKDIYISMSRVIIYQLYTKHDTLFIETLYVLWSKPNVFSLLKFLRKANFGFPSEFISFNFTASKLFLCSNDWILVLKIKHLNSCNCNISYYVNWKNLIVIELFYFKIFTSIVLMCLRKTQWRQPLFLNVLSRFYNFHNTTKDSVSK